GLERGAIIGILEGVARNEPIGIGGLAAMDRDAAAPIGRCLIEREAGVPRDLAPGIDVGGMEPLATKIERLAERGRNGPGTSAQAAARLDQQEAEPARCKALAGGDAARAGTDDDDIEIISALGHSNLDRFVPSCRQ